VVSTVMTRRVGWLTLPVTLAVTVVTFGLGYWQKYACQAAGWPYRIDLIFGRRCYSDAPFLLQNRGMADGIFPYAPNAGEHPLEYPVLSGLVMDATARLARALTPDRGADLNRTYFALTVLVLLGFALLTVWATVRTTGDPRDGLLVAVAPTLALAGTINWDLVAVAATALAVLVWTRETWAGGEGSGRRAWLVGVFVGLGAAAKLYPALLLGPIVLLALRQSTGGARRWVGGQQWRPAATTVAAAASAWLAVNLPVMIAYPDGWQLFYRFNKERGAEFGSPWHSLELLGHPVDSLNSVAMGLFLAGCAGVAALALFARPVPPLAPLAFLVVAAFLVTNKVYSPQYVLWLLPLAVLAGLRLPDLVVWQAVEVAYWFAIWAHLDYRAIDDRWYAAVVFLRIAVTLWLCARVVVGLTLAGGGGGRAWSPQRMWSLRQVPPSDENAAQPAGSPPNRS
jgi:uncharacterized membrane protein